MKKTFFLIALIALLGIGGYVYTSVQKDKKAWKIEIINNEPVNVRENHSPHEYKLTEVYFGEKYQVLDIYLDDLKFVWYKIKLKDKRIGWISSSRGNPYVREYNNPDERFRGVIDIDYKKPEIWFDEDEYYTDSLKTISYDHLRIVEDSDYEINHYIYYEEFPKDRSTPQYWIKYIVTDEFKNVSSKIQRIIFETEPNRNDVLDFKDIRK